MATAVETEILPGHSKRYDVLQIMEIDLCSHQYTKYISKSCS